jgi:hypothetical protein
MSRIPSDDRLLSFDPLYYGGYPNSIRGAHTTNRYPTTRGLNLEERLARTLWLEELRSLHQSQLYSWFEENWDLSSLDEMMIHLAKQHGPYVLRSFRNKLRNATGGASSSESERKISDPPDIKDIPSTYFGKNGLFTTRVILDAIFLRNESEVDKIAGDWYDRHCQPSRCQICGQRYRLLNFPSWVYLGSDGIKSCCMRCEIVDSPTEKELQDLVPAFVETCGFIPSATIDPVTRSFTSRLSEEDQLDVYGLYGRMGGMRHVKEMFGSWFKAMSTTGALPDGVQRTSRGIRCLADDGHECDSLAEKQIDDWLSENGIDHEREPEYPQHDKFNPIGKRRADWKIGSGTFVEYFGMKGKDAYDRKSEEKRRLAENTDIDLIEIYPKDLDDIGSCLGHLPATS